MTTNIWTKKCTLYFLVLFLGPTTTVFAQATISVGPKIGANFSGVNYKGSSDNTAGAYNAKYKLGVEAGLVASINWGHFAVQPAVIYTQHRYQINDDHQEDHGVILRLVNQSDCQFNYLTVPINFIYSLQDNGQGLQGIIGGYAAHLLGGRVMSNGYTDIVNVPGLARTYSSADQMVVAGDNFDNSDNFYSKRYDFGVQLGIGYRVSHLQGQLTYNLGLTNEGAAYQYGNNSPSYHNRSATVSVAYLFGGK